MHDSVPHIIPKNHNWSEINYTYYMNSGEFLYKHDARWWHHKPDDNLCLRWHPTMTPHRNPPEKKKNFSESQQKYHMQKNKKRGGMQHGEGQANSCKGAPHQTARPGRAWPVVTRPLHMHKGSPIAIPLQLRRQLHLLPCVSSTCKMYNDNIKLVPPAEDLIERRGRVAAAAAAETACLGLRLSGLLPQCCNII